METAARKPIVSRIVYVHGNGGRIITFVYIYIRESQQLYYGACIWKPDTPTSSFDKKPHRDTAILRLILNPVVLNCADDSVKLEDFHKKIRNFIHIHGVKGKSGQMGAEEKSKHWDVIRMHGAQGTKKVLETHEMKMQQKMMMQKGG